uniref:Uncharacterized protein n=1 Tax=Salmonella phage PMBT27 TaxID=3137285 RepID=A0AAU8BWE2_9VIRU
MGLQRGIHDLLFRRFYHVERPELRGLFTITLQTHKLLHECAGLV